MCNSVCQPLNLLSAPLNLANLLHILLSNFSTSGLICYKIKSDHIRGVIPVTAWGCIATVLVEVDGILLVGGGIATLLEAWPCVTVLVGIMDDVPLLVGGVAASVGVRSRVVSTVLMLLVVLGPVEV